MVAFVSLGSLVASNTAPTIADNSNTDDTSNGNKNSLNKILPRFFTRPSSGFFNNTGSEAPNDFNDDTSATASIPPPNTAAILIINGLTGSDSLLRLMSISVYKNNTSMAPI